MRTYVRYTQWDGHMRVSQTWKNIQWQWLWLWMPTWTTEYLQRYMHNVHTCVPCMCRLQACIHTCIFGCADSTQWPVTSLHLRQWPIPRFVWDRQQPSACFQWSPEVSCCFLQGEWFFTRTKPNNVTSSMRAFQTVLKSPPDTCKRLAGRKLCNLYWLKLSHDNETLWLLCS